MQLLNREAGTRSRQADRRGHAALVEHGHRHAPHVIVKFPVVEGVTLGANAGELGAHFLGCRLRVDGQTR